MDLLPQTLSHSLEQCAATTQDDVSEQVFTHVIVALHDRVEAVFVDTFKVMASQLRVEKDLGASEALVANQDLSTIWQLVVLLTGV